MNIEELQDKIEEIMTPMPPETYVQYYIDNDLLPSETDKGFQGSWCKEDPYKICYVCKENKHITKYYIRRARTEEVGHLCIVPKCMSCMSDGYKGPPNKKKYTGNAEDRGYALKLAIMEYFGKECNDCGFRGQMCQFDFDHLEPHSKEINLALSALPHTDPIDIIDEVTKVQMLCSNCHRKHSVRYERQNLPNRYAGTASTTLERMAEPVKDREHLRRDSP